LLQSHRYTPSYERGGRFYPHERSAHGSKNLIVYGLIYGVRRLPQKIDELLEHFEIRELAKHRLQHLSSGQHTRVTLCKGFLNDPELLLLDECTVALDPNLAEKTRRALQSV